MAAHIQLYILSASGPAAVVFILTTTATTFLGGLWLEHTDRALTCALDRTLARDPDRTSDCGPDRTLDCSPDHTMDCGPDRLRRPANPQQPLSLDEKKSLKGAVQTAQEMDYCPGPLCKLRHSGSIKIPQFCRR